MAGLVNLVNEWLVRGLVLLSLAANLVLVVFAGIRRHKASGWRRGILWLAYQLADWAATFSIAKLFLGSTSREQQLVAFWLPFLLIHLGRPDNINAYSLEDNALSGRQVVDAVMRVGGAVYVLYKYIIIGGGGGTFLAASVIMFLVGIIKYLERVVALWLADLSSIRSSGKEHMLESFRPGCLDSEQALLVAHRLFHISKGAFADYTSVDQDPFKPYTRDGWPYGREEMCKVVEMELSIMYDILYTKAAVIHTWFGYGIRAVSPLFTATAFSLFWFCSKDGQRRADVHITYILLAATFFLDLRWLLRALGSTWTYAFLNDRPRSRLHHAVLCTGRWRLLRRFVVSLDPCRLVKEPSSYRMWSGKIGRYNLLHEGTHETASLCRTLANTFRFENSWKDYQYHYLRGLDIPPCVRKLLFERIWEKLKLAYRVQEKKEKKKEEKKEEEEKEDKKAEGPVDAVLRRRNKLDNALGFEPELQVDILVGHIATDVFLLCSSQNAASCTHVKAIKALSDYMVFLVAVRPNMLPGLKLSNLLKSTSDALQGIWCEKKCSRAREQKLARFLLEKEMEPPVHGKKRRRLYERSVILSDGTRCAKVLLARLRNEAADKIRKEVGIGHDPRSLEDASDQILDRLISELWRGNKYSGNTPELLLDFILDVWVRMLIYVSIRCSRESHAKQLSRGGELTTIVWILAEHAAVFGIAEYTRRPTDTDRCSVM